ncbi:unnamed protein product [Adineta ricciae]|uniref:Uncharacterized protein n=1 Tax=Adineta ricciae TaxID=249248 RepID=A0A816D2Z6_ADIRI|nr:unnamed protein product [Adineta ricciae]
MDQVFERIHARLDLRFQQLIRQIHAYSHKKTKPILNFSPTNQFQLEEIIAKLGHITVSTTLNDFPILSFLYSFIYKIVNKKRPLTPHAIDSATSMNRSSVRKTTSVAAARITTVTTTTKNESNVKNDHYQIIGKHGRQKGQLSNPQDVFIIRTSPNQRTLLVSDTINQNVQMFSIETGLCTGTFLPSNPRQIPLRRPIGLSHSFADSSSCLVTDYDQHFISSWIIDETGNGKLVKKFGQQSLVGPKGICASNQSQRIAVADNKANCVCLFSSSGEFLHRFGTRGTELHELAGPHYIQFAENDNDRHVIVTDFYNNSVKIFDIERHGQLVTSFGSGGTKNGMFQAPTGLAIDYDRGYIFVSDWGNNRVQVFDRQGVFVRIIELSTSDMLYGPQGLDYEPISQTLAIANSGKHSAVLVRID